MDTNLGIAVVLIAELLVAAGAAAAYKDKFFFVRQMKERGFEKGFPFVIHGAMWSDLFIISPLVGFLVAAYASQWSVESWVIAGVAGMLVSLALHFFVYLKGTLPGSHGYNGNLTTAGWIHVVYTALALQIIALFYFATTSIDHTHLLITSILLALHLPTGLIGQLWANKRHPEWFPENPLKYYGVWIFIAVMVALIGLWTYVLW